MRTIQLFSAAAGFVVLALLAACSSTSHSNTTDDVIELANYSLKYSVETSAKKSTIWRLWSDVENWQKFDTILEYSYLVDNAEFKTGSIGYLNAKGAPKTKFILTEVNDEISFTESLKIPLYQTIDLQRYFEVNNKGKTTFTHEVNFKGSLKSILYFLLSGTFKSELINVMENLKKVAENEEQEALEQHRETQENN
ncbi:MAG: hypothetical protein GXP21_04565 [Gammaproteobacteria bacterium]|nr:hypothetical protein [Gammaproteobacteria bacterium]